MTKKVFLDVECYSNYFLICFKSEDKIRFYEKYAGYPIDIPSISKIMNTYLTVGFNSIAYDLMMIAYALKGASNHHLKKLSDDIIKSDLSKRDLCEKYDISIPLTWNHIDLIGPAPAIGIGLKMYGARMHTKLLQDLPLEPDSIIDMAEHTVIKEYCANDVAITMELYKQIEDRIILREEISKVGTMDLRSKSDAQIAEAIIKKALKVKYYNTNVDTDIIYTYLPPSFVKFKEKELVAFFEEVQKAQFKCNDKGRIVNDTVAIKQVTIKDTKFSVGIGGLHSNEKHTATVSNSEEFLLDVDVTSYYPTIILNNRYYPEQLGNNFLNLYDSFYKQRIEAKKNKDKIKAETYKIILNGSFGKFGSRYSALYSPSLLLHTTLTGQLSLLMLIEEISLNGFEVISANTDGITIKGLKKDSDKLDSILQEWQNISGFNLEKIFYTAIYHESVNSYIAVTVDGKLKCKGIYATEGLTKNPVAQICIEGASLYIKDNKTVESHILENKDDITKFLMIRKVEGGAVYREQYLGKVIRWYYSIDGDVITYKKNGNKVPNSDGSTPLMTLPEEPIIDIDFNRYVEKTYKMLKNLGIK